MSAAASNLRTEPATQFVVEKPSGESDPLDSLPWLPCTLTLEVPVVHFTIADLLGLKEGSIVATAWHRASELPLRVNQVLIGWTEIETVGDRLAVRITEQI